MIENQYTTFFTIKRNALSKIGGFDVIQDTVVGTFKGHIQQTNAEYIQTLGLNMTKPHVIWCSPLVEVFEGDTLETETEQYTVQGKQVNNYGDNAHVELVVQHVGAIAPEESS